MKAGELYSNNKAATSSVGWVTTVHNVFFYSDTFG